MKAILGLIVLGLSVSGCKTGSDDHASAPVDEPSVELHPALGEIEPELASVYADDPLAFAPLREPQPGDWLTIRKEPGQTVAQFVAKGPNVPTAARGTIYFQPIGEFPTTAPRLATLTSYVEVFFGLEVEMLEPVSVEALEVTTREGAFGRQLRTDDVLVALQDLLPDDAFLLVGLTVEDLYPDEDWNYVFGYASFTKRVSVYSLLRLDPRVVDPRTELDEDARASLMLERSLKVMSHELTHSFGVRHCVHYNCLMSGANSSEELDRHPPHLCPVCLRKLHIALGFEPVTRYEALGAYYEDQGVDEAAAWTRARLASFAAAR